MRSAKHSQDDWPESKAMVIWSAPPQEPAQQQQAGAFDKGGPTNRCVRCDELVRQPADAPSMEIRPRMLERACTL